MSLTPTERLIVALDFPSADETLIFVDKMGDMVSFYKVGLELFSTAGPDIVKHLKAAGKSVFLDLKFHDIPNTVAGASVSAVGLGTDMFNVHALGGTAMMRAAAEAAAQAADRLGVDSPIVLAVTILTSHDKETLQHDIGLIIDGDIASLVVAKALQAKEAGLGGVVASAKEAAAIRAACGDEFHIVTPGIRLSGQAAGDQRRITTPSEALAMGADRIVVGRPITRAKEPLAVAREILEDIT